MYGNKTIRAIVSPTNSRVKVFRQALKEGATREGWIAVEGPLSVGEALSAGHFAPGVCTSRVRSVLVARAATGKFAELLEKFPAEVEVIQIPDRLFGQVAQTANPQGIAALVEIDRPSLETILAIPNVLLAVACGLQDPGNLGTMLRSAEALGGNAVITLKSTVSPSNPKVVRSSGGAIFRLPVFVGIDPDGLFPQLQKAGICVIAAHRHAHTPVTGVDLRGPSALLIGREGSGLENDIREKSCLTAAIPVRAGIDSINAAAAAAILFYEAARQRGFHY